MNDSNERLRPELLELAVDGRHLNGRTLGENLGTGATLLVFLRHLG